MITSQGRGLTMNHHLYEEITSYYAIETIWPLLNNLNEFFDFNK
jgi:hypothetical protein